jgi:hypothetical protein
MDILNIFRDNFMRTLMQPAILKDLNDNDFIFMPDCAYRCPWPPASALISWKLLKIQAGGHEALPACVKRRQADLASLI